MDPHPRRSSSKRSRFPRPRGDGPYPVADSGDHPRVSPPTRGWTFLLDRKCRSGRRFPRPRGDGPRTGGRLDHHVEVSPPTRGWTRHRHPAPRSAPRFPRPRGDGPHSATCSRRPRSVSPPTRGWTVIIAVALPLFKGFPAHAGMDRRLLRHAKPLQRFPRPRGDGPST